MPTLIDDTIAAISTPLGRGGIGIVRLSGKGARQICERIFRGRHSRLTDREPSLGTIVEPTTGHPLDQVLLTYFKAPRSYTSEDVVEISCHGSPVVLKRVLGLVLDAGARLANPGEFTLRSFLRGRIDLVQAEAVRDLIEAKTLFQAKVAHQQATGSVSSRLKPTKSRLVELISLLEAGIDFAEDDVTVLSWEEIRQRLAQLAADLQEFHDSFRMGKVVTEGLCVAIIGRPNVGKSSLFNALLQEERAIVTEVPGTTRDIVSETAEIGGVPVRLLDTAGIRNVVDQVENLGIIKSQQALADADRVLLVLDGASAIHSDDLSLLNMVSTRDFHLIVNKIDLPQKAEWGAFARQASNVTRVSAKTREGIDQVRRSLLGNLETDRVLEDDAGFLTNARHERLVWEALEGVRRAEESSRNQLPHEVVLVDLYASLKAINAMTGETTVEDILDHIFSTFCIGK
ncbi:MAG: tRNA uridine-5-carboxymethylaminomethyl(34) synthesis GTPase MnmE [Acidobacteriota bacterium]